MKRSKWKGPYINLKFFRKVSEKNVIFKQPMNINRNVEIVPKFKGLTFIVHNGKKYINLKVTEEMIGHKFGEFAFTRAKFIFKKSNKQR